MGLFHGGLARRVARRSPRNVHVLFSSEQVAASLWDYGEDALVDDALGMSDRQMRLVQRIAATYEDPDYQLPMEGQRITHNHVVAFAAVTLLEGRLRPLNRTRRRPQKNRPEPLQQPRAPDLRTGR